MTKPELGTKRLCAHCGAKFFDLNHAPITCPKCGTVVFEVMPVSLRSRALGVREVAPKVEPVVTLAGVGELPAAEDEVEAESEDDAGLLDEQEEDDAEDPEAADDDEKEDLV
jgi:uncharacterized protein (TIGR02300 family)